MGGIDRRIRGTFGFSGIVDLLTGREEVGRGVVRCNSVKVDVFGGFLVVFVRSVEDVVKRNLGVFVG